MRKAQVKPLTAMEAREHSQFTNGFLVGGWPTPSEKYESVGSLIPNIWKNETCSKPPNRFNREISPDFATKKCWVTCPFADPQRLGSWQSSQRSPQGVFATSRWQCTQSPKRSKSKSLLDMVTYYLWRFHDVSYRNHEIWLFWLLLCLNRDYVLTISIIIS